MERGKGEQIGLFDGLLWYLEARNWAFGKILDSPYGAHPFDIQMHHAIYFTNLFSAIDHFCDHLRADKSAQDAFARDIEESFGGRTAYGYARELRNAIVHRGFDPTAAGYGEGTRLYVLCPATVEGRSNKGARKSYACPLAFKYTFELGAHCNAAANTAIAGALERLDLFNPERHVVDEEEAYGWFFDSKVMPDWGKAYLGEELRAELAAELVASRIMKMRTLLGLDR